MPLTTAILAFVGQALGPLVTLVDSLHTSGEEKGQLKLALAGVQIEFCGKVLDYEARLVEAQLSVVKAEAQGGSWIQRSWRPITMLTFLSLVVADSFGLLQFRLSEQAWFLMQLGLGGYVVGRSAEKVLPTIATSLAAKNGQ